ncbi:Stk1 family PASTA domain-containing Ser/Thr kinase [Pseudonocardia kunmingensis]|uniref:non-specific serine/threonine protein kinase n=1 Tax=Pseudonocardia kunmingensis TaxID=630975 RepID=A0A543DXQ0_9PSEU|nr:Stk1 family PASTA domain-containing Ser/Thr kinase [Pseudonocardia kunmingensis]TQM14107.1 serine/threonine-protein kinase [Pseudonocardia kunmingensis]
MNAPPAALLDARYRVGPLLARGGMSAVYRGTDIRLDRPVAIKVMEPRLAADPAFRARFEREARSAARIDHPAVVDVHDQGEHVSDTGHDSALGLGDGPLLFLVMELVEGGTLRDVLRARGALGVPAAFAVMEPVLAGLAEAHRLGMVHRDVKPENVLISRTGEVKVADFGLVTAAAQSRASSAGMIMGTVAYLSPEQVATGAADARSDVYAAGILLYELLTGAPPYTGDTAISVAYRHVNSDVPPPSQIAGDVPPELDALVLRATRRDPAARPADAAALLAELHRVAVRLDVPRVPPPVPPARPVEDQDTVPAAPRRLTSGAATGAHAGPGGTRAMPRPVDDGPPPHLRARRRSRRVFAVWIAIVLVLAMLVGVSAWWLGSGRWTAMPRLVGLEESAAQRVLADADLVGRLTEAHHDDVDAGLVSATDPPPDARLLRGSTVTVTVSSGRPTVPDVAPGTSVAAAEQAIREAGLTPVRSSEATEDSDSVPEGAVVRTDPEAGEEVATGEPVTIVVSSGEGEPETVRVPMVIGEDYEDAADILEELDLEAEEETAFLIGRENGRVIGQDPPAGATVDRGTTIHLSTV